MSIDNGMNEDTLAKMVRFFLRNQVVDRNTFNEKFAPRYTYQDGVVGVSISEVDCKLGSLFRTGLIKSINNGTKLVWLG